MLFRTLNHCKRITFDTNIKRRIVPQRRYWQRLHMLNKNIYIYSEWWFECINSLRQKIITHYLKWCVRFIWSHQWLDGRWSRFAVHEKYQQIYCNQESWERYSLYWKCSSICGAKKKRNICRLQTTKYEQTIQFSWSLNLSKTTQLHIFIGGRSK